MRKALLSVPQLNARNLIMTSGKLALPDLRAHVHVWKYLQKTYYLFWYKKLAQWFAPLLALFPGFVGSLSV